jgi:cytidylate kinase
MIASSKQEGGGRIRVAIDGPAGVGKTTTARALARELDLLYVDTGAMYRALAVLAAERGISPDDEERSGELARSCEIRLLSSPQADLRVLADGRDVTEVIRSRAASDAASRISTHPPVREAMVGWQRSLAAAGGVVMEGRDIGTVVLPDAEAKIFLTASPEERARRRHRELLSQGQNPTFQSVLRDIRERDSRDQEREASPLRPAPDAVVLDCTALDAPSQIAAVRRIVVARVAMNEAGADSA